MLRRLLMVIWEHKFISVDDIIRMMGIDKSLFNHLMSNLISSKYIDICNKDVELCKMCDVRCTYSEGNVFTIYFITDTGMKYMRK